MVLRHKQCSKPLEQKGFILLVLIWKLVDSRQPYLFPQMCADTIFKNKMEVL